MNMSDDVAGATLQVSMQAAEKSMEIGSKIADKALDDIARLLKAFGKTVGKIIKSKTDLSDINAGNTSIKKLVKNARLIGDTISTSDNAFSDADMKILQNKAKNYGIPIAFTGEKENNYANVRTSDLPIFQRMCTDMMKEKLAQRPQELGNFKVKEWEIPFITNELNNYDLSAQFGKTKNGESFCLYEKTDEKAIMIARNEFVKKCDELKQNMTITKNEDFFVIKDKHSDKEVSFDKIPSREELSEQIQNNFGYDKNKADIACAKFGEENLKGEEKQKFFSKNPQNNFSKIDTNITIKGESIFAKNYTCWRVVPKSDSVPRIVFQDEKGKFAVLNPEKQTKKSMKKILSESLNITDKNTLDALIDKAAKITDYYHVENIKSMSDVQKFDESDLMLYHYDQLQTRIDDSDRVHVTIPQTVSCFVERQDKDYFSVTSAMEGKETVYENGDKLKENKVSDKQELLLSFSDKKNALNQLKELYKKQGIPEDIAKQMSIEMFEKAELQNAEKVLNIEEIKAETKSGKTEMKMTVSTGNHSEEFDITDSEKAVSEISEKFEVPEETAIIVLEKAQENIEENADEEVTLESNAEEIQKNSEEISQMSNLNSNNSDVPDTPPEMPDFSSNLADNIDTPDVPQTPDLPKIDIPVGRGSR